VSGGVQQVRVVLRALALLQLAEGVSASRIAGMVPLTAQAIREIGHRYLRFRFRPVCPRIAVPQKMAISRVQLHDRKPVPYEDAIRTSLQATRYWPGAEASTPKQ
jgi:hypothetical protein